MNSLSIITNFLISLLEMDPLNNTVTFTKTNAIDYNKENIYPLTNLDLTSSLIGEQIIEVDFIVTILSQRNIKPKLDNDKIYNSNMIDNLNECHTIGTKLINRMRQHNIYDITLGEISNLTMLKQVNNNELDGVQFTMTLQIENDISSC